MKSLFKYLSESMGLRPVVIYGGKFQPFHAGHYEIYQKLCKEFGKNNVFISTQDINKSKLGQKSYRENHVFSFNEKVKIMTGLFGIPEKQIIRVVRTPYLPSWKEIPVSGSDYALITIAGEKDGERFKQLGGNGMTIEEYQPGMSLQSCLDHKYYYHVGNDKVHLSATEIRDFLGKRKM
jgi:cytidyltransferase-like protein